LKETKKESKAMSCSSCESKAKGTIVCPKCSEIGQLKLRKLNTPNVHKYWQVDHYKQPSSHTSGYERSCYLGVESAFDLKQLKGDST
jgi:hypothetical protein